MKNIIAFLFVAGLLVLPFSGNAQTYSFDFSPGYEGWSGDFADYPAVDSVFYELACGRMPLPLPLDTQQYSLMITGNNHSDDLFMFIKRKITGLLPNTSYRLLIDVTFASNAPTNAFGVGGPPGEAVTMKAGATLVEPQKVNSGGFYFMNIDKGNQVMGGADMDTIGHVGVSDTTTEYTLVNRNNASHLFQITTDSEGTVWVCIGTDSGFEATTKLYYHQINLAFSLVSGLADRPSSTHISIYPNPTPDMLNVHIAPMPSEQSYIISDLFGRQVMEGTLTSGCTSLDLSLLPAGSYFLRIGEDITFKSVIKK